MSDEQKDNSHVFKGTYDMLHDTAEQIKHDLSEIHLTEMEGSMPKEPDSRRCDPSEYV